MTMDWKKFCLVNAETNRTSEESEYDEEDYEFVYDSDKDVVVELLSSTISAGADPTECLNDYLNSILGDSSRYGFGDQFAEPVIKKCMDLGASFPYNRLFEKRYKNPEHWVGLEQETSDYNVRGFIIDLLKPECVHDYAKWSHLGCGSWEEIEYYLPHDYKLADLPDETRYAVLKYNSSYLKSFDRY